MVSAAAFTYKTKHEAEDQLAEVRKIEAADQLRAGHDRPAQGGLEPADPALAPAEARRDLPGRARSSQPVEASQIGGIEELPPKPVDIPDLSTERLGGMADNGQGPHRYRGGGAMKSLLAQDQRQVRGQGAVRPADIVVDGARKATGGKARNRVVMTMAVFFGIYRRHRRAAGLSRHAGSGGFRAARNARDRVAPRHRRPQRRGAGDRHQDVVAVRRAAPASSMPTRRSRRSSTVLPDLDYEQTYHKLKSGTGFVWLRRQLSPKQQSDIMKLGIPGIGFRTEKRRFYPGGSTAVAHHRPDQHRQPGHRRAWRNTSTSRASPTCRLPAWRWRRTCKPVRLSIDLRVQHIVRDEIVAGDGSLPRHRRRRRRAQRQDRRGAWRWRRCRTSIPTIRSMRRTRTG